MKPVTASHINSLDAARTHIQGFPCPSGFSPFAWRQLQKTALSVWHAHLSHRPFRGALHFCRPEFYAMLAQPDGSPIVQTGAIRGYKAA